MNVTGKIAATVIAASIGFGAAIADHHGGAVEQALKSAMRSDAFVANDVKRKPGKILKLAGVKPGMTVLDINSYTGYYAEIVAGAVGSEGKVIAHNGPAYWNYMEKKAPENLSKFTNVVQVQNGSEGFDFQEENSVDVALSILGFHDLYADAKAYSEDDIIGFMKSLHKALKPGGVVIVADHVGVAGGSIEAVKKIHRIDPARVQAVFEKAGFKLVEQSDILSNPDNPPTEPWFGKPSYQTDRFVMKFMK